MYKIIEKIKKKQENLQENESITIVFLGDSVTQGCFECYKTGPSSLETVFDYSSAYSTRLREMFSILYPNVQINIINSGISGDGVEGGILRLDRDVLSYHPDLVVVSYGLNDAGNGLENLNRYGECLKDIFNRIKDLGAECIFLTENMMNTKTSCHLTDHFLIGIAERFAKIENDGVLEAYFEKAKEIAATCGVGVCDCYAKWKKLQSAGVDTTELLANKLNHPIREMQYLFAISLLEVLFA